MTDKLFKLISLILIFLLANILGALLIGFLATTTAGMGGNIAMTGFKKLLFDPIITIAYLMVFYFLTLFYQPSSKNQHKLFIFTLLLSFTLNFTQGSLLLVFLYFLLRKARFI